MKNYTRVHHLALATAGATFLLLLLGGIVHATDSGLACGRVWPSCEGTWFPRMTGGVLYEHSHRLWAGFVGLLTLGLALALWLSPSARLRTRLLGTGAVALVVFQALLGRKTVLEGLPAWVSASHLATAMAFFGLLIWIALQVRPTPNHSSRPLPRVLRWALPLTALVVYVQIVLGAVVRHTDAGLACTAFPLCQGTWWGEQLLMQLHMAHRLGGVAVAAVVCSVSWLALRRASAHPAIAAGARLAPALVLLQVLLGVASVLTALEPLVVTAHLGLGAALFALQVALAVIALEGPAEPTSASVPGTSGAGPVPDAAQGAA